MADLADQSKFAVADEEELDRLETGEQELGCMLNAC